MVVQKKIGEINGRWAVLFKVVLVTIPLSIPLLVWLISSAWASNDHIRHSDEVTTAVKELLGTHSRDMEFVRQEIKEIDKRIDELPSTVWRERIVSLESEMKQNAADHTEIKISLEQIKAKMGIAPGDK